MKSKPPPDGEARVHVLLTLDRSFFHRLGLSRFTYVRSLRRAGARVTILDESDFEVEAPAADTAARLLDGVDGLVLSGGGDIDPALYGGEPSASKAVRAERDRFELALLEEAGSRRVPILGICRGAQLLNVARGGTLRTIRSDEELRRRHGRFRSHPVDLEPGSRLAALFGTERLERVVSYHGQAVARPGSGLSVVGRSEDGVVEAIELAGAKASWQVGVQWHPELSPRSRLQRRLFSSLVDAARRFRTRTD